MNLFDYCEILEERGETKLLNFKGTAHLIEEVLDGENDLDSGEYWVQGIDGESEEEFLSYVKTLPNGVYNLHTYRWMVTDWSEEDGLLWEEYDSGGTICDTVEVRDGVINPCAS